MTLRVERDVGVIKSAAGMCTFSVVARGSHLRMSGHPGTERLGFRAPGMRGEARSRVCGRARIRRSHMGLTLAPRPGKSASRQLIEQRLGVLQDWRVEAFGELAVDGGRALLCCSLAPEATSSQLSDRRVAVRARAISCSSRTRSGSRKKRVPFGCSFGGCGLSMDRNTRRGASFHLTPPRSQPRSLLFF
jgi:hypothetical protein